MVDYAFVRKLDNLVKDLQKNGDVKTIPMARLKALHGSSRLKSLVRESISAGLEQRGLGHVGKELPNSETAHVRLYIKGTAVARIIEAVELEGKGGDARLRELASGTSALATQDFIQRLKVVISQFDETDETDETDEADEYVMDESEDI